MQYRKFRPSHSIRIKDDPKAYWKFAAGAILDEIHQRNYKWSWAYFEKRRNERKQYVELYKKYLKQKKISKETPETSELKKLEYDLSYEDIAFYRSLAHAAYRKEMSPVSSPTTKTAAAKNQGGWFTSWWGGSVCLQIGYLHEFCRRHLQNQV